MKYKVGDRVYLFRNRESYNIGSFKPMWCTITSRPTGFDYNVQFDKILLDISGETSWNSRGVYKEDLVLITKLKLKKLLKG